MTIEQQLKYIFDTLEAARVTITEFSEITKTSKTTFHNWKSGRWRGRGVDTVHLTNATKYAKKIESATAKGKLPLPKPQNRGRQKARTERVLEAIT